MTSEYEDVEGWAQLHGDDSRLVDGEELEGPDHPDYPAASDDIDWPDGSDLRSPCGDEDRVRKRQTGQFPWSAICFLIIKKGGSSYRGTGFFIAPDTVVTAGHCLLSRNGGATRIQVIPGRDDRDFPFGSIASREFYMPDEWREERATAFDYGVIKLANGSMGARTGHFQFANLSNDVLAAARLNTAGYPHDMTPSHGLHYNGGPTKMVERQRLHYCLDTARGASGSPVWIKSGDQRTVVGIHNNGGCPNRATRINDRVLDDLTDWSR